jgi:hypothetical protein
VKPLSHDVSSVQRELEANGYAVLPGIVSRSLLEDFTRTILDMYERAPKFKGGGMVTGHLNCFPGRAARSAFDELRAAGIVELAEALRPGRPNDVRVTLNFNLPGSVAQHLHIDGAYLDDFLICNVAVVDTTLANGAMQVIPGSNRTFLPFWKYALTRQRRHATRVEMAAGDVLLRKSNLWHRGMPNTSATPRPLLSYTFGEMSAPAGDPFEVNGGEPLFYANWYNTSRAGRAREHMFKTVPISYAAYRFVDSLRPGKRGYESW